MLLLKVNVLNVFLGTAQYDGFQRLDLFLIKGLRLPALILATFILDLR